MYESSTETIQQAIAAAVANDTTAYEVYIKKSKRGKTLVSINFAKNPGELNAYWRNNIHAYGEQARVVGYVALN